MILAFGNAVILKNQKTHIHTMKIKLAQCVLKDSYGLFFLSDAKRLGKTKETGEKKNDNNNNTEGASGAANGK